MRRRVLVGGAIGVARRADRGRRWWRSPCRRGCAGWSSDRARSPRAGSRPASRSTRRTSSARWPARWTRCSGSSSSSTAVASGSSPPRRTSCARRCSRCRATSSCCGTRTSTTTPGASFVAQLAEQTERLTRLCFDLLDLSRLESGGVELRPENTDLHALAARVAQEFAPIVERDGRSLDVRLVGEPVVHACDPDARRAARPHPGRQRAQAHRSGRRGADPGLAPAAVRPRSRSPTRGRESSPEDLPNIFEPFHGASDGSGAGLGPGDRPGDRPPDAGRADGRVAAGRARRSRCVCRCRSRCAPRRLSGGPVAPGEVRRRSGGSCGARRGAIRSASMSDRAAAAGPRLQPGAGDLRHRRDDHAGHRRAGDGADGAWRRTGARPGSPTRWAAGDADRAREAKGGRSRSTRRPAGRTTCGSWSATTWPTSGSTASCANPMLWFIQHYLWDHLERAGRARGRGRGVRVRLQDRQPGSGRRGGRGDRRRRRRRS